MRNRSDKENIEKARAALAAILKKEYPQVPPAKQADSLRLRGDLAELAHVGDMRYVLETIIPEHLHVQHQRYGEAQSELDRVAGGILYLGIRSRLELNELLASENKQKVA